MTSLPIPNRVSRTFSPNRETAFRIIIPLESRPAVPAIRTLSAVPGHVGRADRAESGLEFEESFIADALDSVEVTVVVAFGDGDGHVDLLAFGCVRVDHVAAVADAGLSIPVGVGGAGGDLGADSIDLLIARLAEADFLDGIIDLILLADRNNNSQADPDIIPSVAISADTFLTIENLIPSSITLDTQFLRNIHREPTIASTDTANEDTIGRADGDLIALAAHLVQVEAGIAEAGIGLGIVVAVLGAFLGDALAGGVAFEASDALAFPVEILFVGLLADLLAFAGVGVVFSLDWADLATVADQVASRIALTFAGKPNLAVLALCPADLKVRLVDLTIEAFLADTLDHIVA